MLIRAAVQATRQGPDHRGRVQRPEASSRWKRVKGSEEVPQSTHPVGEGSFLHRTLNTRELRTEGLVHSPVGFAPTRVCVYG